MRIQISLPSKGSFPLLTCSPIPIQHPKLLSLIQDPCHRLQLENNLALFSLEPPTRTQPHTQELPAFVCKPSTSPRATLSHSQPPLPLNTCSAEPPRRLGGSLLPRKTGRSAPHRMERQQPARLGAPSPRQATRTLCRPSAACSLRGLAHPHTLPGAGSPTWAELGRCVGCVYPLCKWHNTTGNEDHAVRGAQTLLDLPQKRKETCQAKR